MTDDWTQSMDRLYLAVPQKDQLTNNFFQSEKIIFGLFEIICSIVLCFGYRSRLRPRGGLR